MAAGAPARPLRSTMRLKRGDGGTPVIGEIALAIVRADARGDDALGLDRDHARQAGERVPGGVSARLDEGDGDVLTLGVPELRQDQADRSRR